MRDLWTERKEKESILQRITEMYEEIKHKIKG